MEDADRISNKQFTVHLLIPSIQNISKQIGFSKPQPSSDTAHGIWVRQVLLQSHIEMKVLAKSSTLGGGEDLLPRDIVVILLSHIEPRLIKGVLCSLGYCIYGANRTFFHLLKMD
jgi:hypothetical protein